jgi:hypothetical protein
MKQIHIWKHHVRIPHLDLVLHRSQPESLDHTLTHLARLGFDTRSGNVEVYDGAVSD